MNGTAASYDSNDLQTDWIFTAAIKHENWPTRQAIPYILAHANGQTIPFTEFTGKMITLQGTIKGSGIEDADNKIDIFKGYFPGVGKNLDIGYGGSTRRYVCVVVDCLVDRPDGLGHANFTVTIACLQAFGVDINQTTLLNATSITAAARTDNVTIGGNAPEQLPVATITLHSFTGSGSQTISFGNNNNGQQINITRSTWTAGDVIQIDSVNSIVTVNGGIVDFTGAFIELPPGLQQMGYSDSFSARNFDYNVALYQRWL